MLSLLTLLTITCSRCFPMTPKVTYLGRIGLILQLFLFLSSPKCLHFLLCLYKLEGLDMSLLIMNRKTIIILKTLTHFNAIFYVTCSGIVFGMPFFLIFTINPLYLCNWKHHVFSF